MEDQVVDGEVTNVTEAAAQPQGQEVKIDIDPQTAFQLQLQDFDAKIAEAELKVAELKRDKTKYVKEFNVNGIVAAYQEKKLKEQIEAETRQKIQAAAEQQK